MRAIARFAAGEEQQGIADLKELRLFDSITPPAADDDEDGSKGALELSQSLSAMMALVGDWKSCSETLPSVSNGASGKNPALRDLGSGCKALSPAATPSSVHLALAASTAPESAPKPFVYPVEEHLRLFAWEALGLYTEAMKEADSAGMDAARSALIQSRIDGSEKEKAKLLSGGAHSVSAELLLQLGQHAQALRVAEEELRQQTSLLQKAQALKKKCKSCGAVADTFVSSVAEVRLHRAVALFSTGKQNDALADVLKRKRCCFLHSLHDLMTQVRNQPLGQRQLL